MASFADNFHVIASTAALLAVLTWGSFIVFKQGKPIPDLGGPTIFVTSMFAVGQAGKTITSVFGPNATLTIGGATGPTGTQAS